MYSIFTFQLPIPSACISVFTFQFLYNRHIFCIYLPAPYSVMYVLVYLLSSPYAIGMYSVFTFQPLFRRHVLVYLLSSPYAIGIYSIFTFQPPIPLATMQYSGYWKKNKRTLNINWINLTLCWKSLGFVYNTPPYKGFFSFSSFKKMPLNVIIWIHYESRTMARQKCLIIPQYICLILFCCFLNQFESIIIYIHLDISLTVIRARVFLLEIYFYTNLF